jgi:hypothetical protein
VPAASAGGVDPGAVNRTSSLRLAGYHQEATVLRIVFDLIESHEFQEQVF